MSSLTITRKGTGKVSSLTITRKGTGKMSSPTIVKEDSNTKRFQRTLISYDMDAQYANFRGKSPSSRHKTTLKQHNITRERTRKVSRCSHYNNKTYKEGEWQAEDVRKYQKSKMRYLSLPQLGFIVVLVLYTCCRPYCFVPCASARFWCRRFILFYIHHVTLLSLDCCLYPLL